MKITSGGRLANEDFSVNQLLKLEFYKVLNNIMAEIKWRYEKLSIISNDFEFLSGHSLCETPVEIMKKSAADLAIKYDEDIGPEIINKI